MPNIYELGAGVGDRVRYFPSINGVTYGPSYSPKAFEAEIVAIEIEKRGGAYWQTEVVLYPPHEGDLPQWGVQNLVTGEIHAPANLVNYDRELRKWQLAMQINPEKERFVSFHIGSDRRRFPPQTVLQELYDRLNPLLFVGAVITLVILGVRGDKR